MGLYPLALARIFHSIIHSILFGQGSKLQSSGSFNVHIYLLSVVPFLLVPFFLCLKSELWPYFLCFQGGSDRPVYVSFVRSMGFPKMSRILTVAP